MNSQRQSNMELMRVLCMLFIVLGHAIHALNIYSTIPNVGDEAIWRTMVEAFCVVGVNGFVLISGWFGIKFKWQGLLNLYLICAFYSGMLYLVHLGLISGSINRWCLYRTIMPFSFNPGWWFVPCYICLYLLSPILNKSIEVMNKKEHLFALTILTIINVYFGFYRQMEVNATGYNVMNFIYVYFIGRYLSKYFNYNDSKIRTYSIFVFLGGSILLGWLTIMNEMNWHIVSPLLECTMYYNHPLVLINSIAFLLIFSTFKFKCSVINWFSSSILAVYLLTDNNLAVGHLWYKTVANAYNSTPPCYSQAIVITIALLSLIMAVIIDKPRWYINEKIIKRVTCKFLSIQSMWLLK